MLTNSKTFQLFIDSETLLEYIELTWESIKTKDNSTLICSTKVHMLCFQLTRLHLLDKPSHLMPHMLSQERDLLLRDRMLLFFKLLKNGLTIFSLAQSSEVTKLLNWKKPTNKQVTLMYVLKSFKFLNLMNTLTNSNSEMHQVKLSTP